MLRSSLRQTVLICVFLVLVLVFVTTFRLGVVSGSSMSPTYQDGQIVLVRRINSLGRSLRRGDVVLVRSEHDVIIKRIFKVAGDELDHAFPDVLRSTLAHDLADYYEQKSAPADGGTTTRYYVPDGYLVVVGDNTNNSEDSRVFGPVSVKDVLGVVVAAPPAPYSRPGFSGAAAAPQEQYGGSQFRRSFRRGDGSMPGGAGYSNRP